MSAETIPLIIDGHDVVDTPSHVFKPNPDSGRPQTWKAQGATVEHCGKAVESSARAFKTWRTSAPLERMKLFNKLVTLFEENASHMRALVRSELNCPEPVAQVNVQDCIDLAQHLSGLLGSSMLSDSTVSPTVVTPGARALVVKQPYGVVLGIAPWNMPGFLGFRAVAAAVAAGNCVILKGSELSPRTHYFIASLFRSAGFPPGVLNFLVHRPEDAAEIFHSLISHPSVRKCNFTGSTNVGRVIASKAASFLKPVMLELGGKNYALVLDDADLEYAADKILLGAVLNNGQVCMSTDIVLVSPAKKNSLLSLLKSKLESAAVTHVSRAINDKGSERLQRLVADASSKGAILTQTGLDDSGQFPRAVLIENLSPDMEFWATESFGPVVGVATYNTVEEAVDMINQCEYGLSAAIFAADGLSAVGLASQLEVGAVHINESTIHDEAVLPHGGFKSSGWGRFGGRWGLEEFTQTQTIIVNPTRSV